MPAARPSTRLARLLLSNEDFCRDADRRVRAASDLVDGLPRTAPDIEILLSCLPQLSRLPRRLSREVQYSVLNFLDYSTISPKHIELLLPGVKGLLYGLDTDAAFVWMKIGCLLGDGWHEAAGTDLRKKLRSLLVDAVRNARWSSGRRGALHGIEHLLNEVPLLAGKKLLDIVREVALKDHATSVRRGAYFILRKCDWWGGRGLPELHRYARKLGRNLQYPQRRQKQRTGK